MNHSTKSLHISYATFIARDGATQGVVPGANCEPAVNRLGYGAVRNVGIIIPVEGETRLGTPPRQSALVLLLLRGSIFLLRGTLGGLLANAVLVGSRQGSYSAPGLPLPHTCCKSRHKIVFA